MANGPEEDAVQAAQDILKQDPELDRPVTFAVRLVDLAPLATSFHIQSLAIMNTLHGVAFNPRLAADPLVSEIRNNPARMNRLIGSIASYQESLDSQIDEEMTRAEMEARRGAVQISDDPTEQRFEIAQMAPIVTFSYRQVQRIGERTCERVNKSLQEALDPEIERKGFDAETARSGAVYKAKAFLYFNRAFVRAGGRDNQVLRESLEEVVNQWWRLDTMIGGDPMPWDPDYFSKR